MHSKYKLLYIIISLCLIFFGVSYIFLYYQEKPENDVILPSLVVDGKQTKLLVFAPHCDDETLGCAGVIQDVINSGGQVLIVFMTNGDGFTIATKEQFHRFFLHSDDYINSGYARQLEAVNALRLLGVPDSQIFFLGYPDRGLRTIWNDNWNKALPYRSSYTNSNQSPYTNSYQPNAPYSGETVLENIEQIMYHFQPNLILAPHPADEHPDHATTWAFVATAYLKLNISGHLPETNFFTYLVHRRDFPIPHGYIADAALLPPRPLYEEQVPKWCSYQLSAEVQAIKEQALQQYISQLHVPIMSRLLYSFIRKNELFEVAYLPVIKEKPPAADLSTIEAWVQQKPIELNPRGVSILGALERGAKVSFIDSCLEDNKIWLRLNIPELSRKRNQYQLTIIEFRSQENNLNRQQQVFNFSTAGTDLGSEDIFFFQDDVVIRLPNKQNILPDFLLIQVVTKDRFGVIIDHTAWQPIITK